MACPLPKVMLSNALCRERKERMYRLEETGCCVVRTGNEGGDYAVTTASSHPQSAFWPDYLAASCHVPRSDCVPQNSSRAPARPTADSARSAI